MKKIVVFKCGNEEFGIYVESVWEVRRVSEFIHVPHAPEFVDGISHIRGRPVAIVDLAKRLGLEKNGVSEKNRIVIVKSKGTIIGLVVDSVSEVLDVSEANIEKPPKIALPVNDNFITDVTDIKGRMIFVLNLDEILTSEEAEKIKKIKKSQITNQKSQ